MKTLPFIAAAAVFFISSSLPQARAAEPSVPSLTAAAVASSKLKATWDIAFLSQTPRTFPATGFDSNGVQALFYQGLPYKGKSTKIFAYIGIPELKGNEKVPAMVLVHGGGGTAFADWVRLWTSRGYAAIAMDTSGSMPTGEPFGRTPNPDGGPNTWGGFEQINEPIEDQWTYQAVADIMLAHSLLRSRPEVDANRIGITGISWGGYLTCITAGVDTRFKFAVPVYGCGFIGDNSAWLGFLRDEKAGGTKWLGLWDPSRYLVKAKMPFLWVYGTNDTAYPMDSVQKSYQLLAAKQSTLSTHVRMPHGHGGPGENPEEIHAFANHHLKGGPALARIRTAERKGNAVTVRYTAEKPITRAELNFTKGRGSWLERNWETAPAQLDARKREVKATLPAGVSVYYVSIIDDKGLVVSTEHVEIAATR